MNWEKIKFGYDTIALFIFVGFYLFMEIMMPDTMSQKVNIDVPFRIAPLIIGVLFIPKYIRFIQYLRRKSEVKI